MGLASHGWYTFAVGKHARKEFIEKEIERMYHVNVVTVRTVAMHGKVRRTGKKMIANHKADWKKAIVLLKAGQKIDAFEVTKQEEPIVPAAPEKKEMEASKAEAPNAGKKTTNKKTIKSDESKKAR